MEQRTGHATQELSGKGLDVMAWEGGKFILLEEVVYAHA